MSTITPLLMLVWIGLAYVSFRKLPGPLAVLLIVFGGQMFLPEIRAESSDPLMPAPLALPMLKFTKANTIGFALLFGSCTTDWQRWTRTLPTWLDLPMLAWCISPMLSSLASPSGGVYEGATLTWYQFISWGVPYWCARLYLCDWFGIRAICAAIVLSGIVYAPLCLFEIKMSPQLHLGLYGFHQHEFQQSVRAGGYRPMVFMEHGLMVSFWMMTAALVAFWLWHEGAFRAVTLIPRYVTLGLGWVALGLAGVVALSHSAGAVVLGLLGATALWTARWTRSTIPLVILVLVPIAYLAVRYTEVWDGQDMVQLVRQYASKDRAESLDMRLRNEYRLLARAKEQPLFGWGDSGDARKLEENANRERVITDSLWIIALGNRGLFGLVALVAALIAPIVWQMWHNPPQLWRGGIDAPAAVLSIALNLYLLDHMINAMINPAFMLIAGALLSAPPNQALHETTSESTVPPSS